MGLRKMVNRRSCKDLHRNIRVEVDGKQVDMPPVEGIIILNILRCVPGSYHPRGVPGSYHPRGVPGHITPGGTGLISPQGCTGLISPQGGTGLISPQGGTGLISPQEGGYGKQVDMPPVEGIIILNITPGVYLVSPKI